MCQRCHLQVQHLILRQRVPLSYVLPSILLLVYFCSLFFCFFTNLFFLFFFSFCLIGVDGALVAGNGVGGQVSRTDRYRRYSVDSSLSSFGFRVDFMSNSTAAFTLLVASNLVCLETRRR